MTLYDKKRKPEQGKTGSHQISRTGATNLRRQSNGKAAWNGTELPLTTVQRTSNRVRGRKLAILAFTGILLGFFLSVALYLFNLVQLIKPLNPPGDPTASLDALAAACELIDPLEESVPAIETVAWSSGIGKPQPLTLAWAPNISKSKAMLEIAMEQYRAVQSIEPRSDPQVHNILLISKPLDGQSGLVTSESLMVLSINRRTNRVGLVTFDRTMPVNIPGMGWSLLGHAACMGGADLVRKTMAENFRLHIDDAIVFDIADISRSVNMLDGIQMRVTAPEITYLRKNQPQLDVSEGLNQMNGEMALAYSQIAGVGDRHEQNRRLLRVFEAIHARSATRSLLKLKPMAETLLPSLETDLSTAGRFSVLSDVVMSRGYPIATWAFSLDDPTEAYLQTLMTQQKRAAGAAYRVMMLHAFLFGSSALANPPVSQ